MPEQAGLPPACQGVGLCGARRPSGRLHRQGKVSVPKKRSLDSRPYRRLFDAFPVGLAAVDRELVIQYSNRNFTKLFGVKGDAKGRRITNFFSFAGIEGLVRCAGRDRKSKEAELKISLPRHESAFFKATIIPFGLDLSAPARPSAAAQAGLSAAAQAGLSAAAQAGSKRESLFLITLENVSERICLEEQLLQAEKLSAMGHMAASIAHELGNPLSIMISSLKCLGLSLQPADREVEEQIEIMRENAVRMHELLTSLVDMSGLGRFQLEWENIHKAIMPVLSFVRKTAEESGITVEIELASELPLCRIDLRLIKQLFLNLLKNAIEAMPRGGAINVRSQYHPRPPVGAYTQTRDVSSEQGFVHVEVQDSGRGVPSADLQAIFKPFYSTKRRGMGLGLSLCKGIVEKHGGRIRVESQEGKGSCFTVEIPVNNCGL